MKLSSKIKALAVLIPIFLLGCMPEKQCRQDEFINISFWVEGESNPDAAPISITVDLGRGKIAYSGLNGERMRSGNYAIGKMLSALKGGASAVEIEQASKDLEEIMKEEGVVGNDYNAYLQKLEKTMPSKIDVSKELSAAQIEELYRIYEELSACDLSRCRLSDTGGAACFSGKISLSNGKSFIFRRVYAVVDSTDMAEPPYHPLKNPEACGEYFKNYRFGWDETPVPDLLILVKKIFAKELHLLKKELPALN